MKNIIHIKKDKIIKDQNGRKYIVKQGLGHKWRSITPTAYITSDRPSKNRIIPMKSKLNPKLITQQWS
jgi:hypothetical protein